MRRRRWMLATIAVAGLAMAGCGDDSAPSITGSAPPTSATAETTTSTTEAADVDATLTVASTALGEVLADQTGRTLYVFTQDRPNTSTCSGGCLTIWPRYTPQELTGVTGLAPDLIGSINVDGVQQATFDRMPLYYYAEDNEPGDVNGHGVNGQWFAVRPNGEPVS